MCYASEKQKEYRKNLLSLLLVTCYYMRASSCIFNDIGHFGEGFKNP